jgi:hypothetical protein
MLADSGSTNWVVHVEKVGNYLVHRLQSSLQPPATPRKEERLPK